jgi:glycosyltransferase involved in cell wall biosynthesis
MNDAMRLAIVNYVWDPAAESPQGLLDGFPSLTGWASAVHAAGCDPVVVCQRFTVRADLLHNGIIYRFRPDRGQPQPGLTFSGASLVHASAAAVRPDVVHVNGALHPVLVKRLRHKLPKRTAIVVQAHGRFDPARLSRSGRVAVRRSLSAVDALLIADPAKAINWRESGVAPPDLEIAEVMEASTSLAPIERSAARRASGVDGAPALLWVGRLNAHKDPMTVLRGFALFAGRFPTARLTMVYGESDLEEPVRREIARTPALESRVRLVGRVPHDALAAYYSAADLFVVGSHGEGSGDAVLEAMACGAVPVVSDIPSFRALTGSERIGALWKPGQPQAFADALARMAAKPLLTQREATRTRFERLYSWQAIGWKAAEICRRAIERRRNGRMG